MIKIVIPSHNRSDAVKPLSFIPDDYAKQTYIVVRSGEQEELYAKYKEKYNVIAFDGLTGISDKRDAICRYFANEKIWMIDDDCLLYTTWIEDTPLELVKTRDIVDRDQFYEFIDYVSEMLDKHPHGAVRPDLFARRKQQCFPYKLNTFTFTNVLLNLKTVDADLLNYRFVQHTEDAVAFLSVIEKGFSSFCLSKWMVRTDKPGKPGGISEVRTADLITESNIKINERFPQYTYLKKGYGIKTANKVVKPTTLVMKINRKGKGKKKAE